MQPEKVRIRHCNNGTLISRIRAELLEKQGGCCGLCGKPCEFPCVDHDHTHGHIRAVLCARCNNGLALVESKGKTPTPEQVEYLREHGSLPGSAPPPMVELERQPRGRPMRYPDATRVTIYLTPEEFAQLREIGDGNMSEGIRRLVYKYAA